MRLGTILARSFRLHSTLTSRAPRRVPFDAREASITSIHKQLLRNETTALEVTQAHLARIAAFDHKVNAIISLNPAALKDAALIDAQLRSRQITFDSHPLAGIPVLLKDNFDAAGIPTTGGCLALRDNIPAEDAPTVRALRDAGAIILGKTNLHELALEGLSVSSLGGQTINPFDMSRTPGGSSGGSAVAVALSFAVLATGTDTVNSLRNPASANGLISVRPTRDLVSRSGILPVSYTQDTVGPLGRRVRDVATMLQVMRNGTYDPSDNATTQKPEQESYLDKLESGQLQGQRIGVVRGFFGESADSETKPVNEAMYKVIEKLKDHGVSIVNIEDGVFNALEILRTLDTQRYEYREQMNGYLQRLDLKGRQPRTLNELYAGQDFLVIPAQYEYVNTALVASTSDATYHSVLQGIDRLRLHLLGTFRSLRLDALMYPQQKNLVVKIGSPSQSGRNGILAAVTGFPVVTLPAGLSADDAEAPRGVPIGMELMGRPWSEASLLRLAWQMEEHLLYRRMPLYGDTFVRGEPYQEIPSIRPNIGDIPRQYPLGTLG